MFPIFNGSGSEIKIGIYVVKIAWIHNYDSFGCFTKIAAGHLFLCKKCSVCAKSGTPSAAESVLGRTWLFQIYFLSPSH